jgi:hypothetical protein
MPDPILCKICGQRRAKRACPAVQAEICPICCGTQREVSLSCPLDCLYLREGHKHEKPVPLPPADIADRDVEVSEDFLRSREELMLFCMFALLQGCLRTPGALDSDLQEALGAIVQTLRTAKSGLIYETRSQNTIAAAIQRSFSESLAGYQKTLEEQEHLSRIPDSDLLPVLVLLRRLSQQNNNGRPRGRMFIGMLSEMVPSTSVDERAPSIIL